MGAKPIRLAALGLAALLSGAVVTAHTLPAGAQGKAAKPAETEDVKEQAKQAYTEAQEKFDAGDYAGAVELYKKADELYPGAAPKHKIAITYDKLGKTKEAIAAYEAFIASDPGEKYADRVAEAKKRIEQLKATTPGKVTVKVSPEGVAGVTITVDGKPVEGGEFELPAGEHTLVITAEGHQPVTEVVTVKGGEMRELAVTLTPAAKKVAPVPKPKPEGEEEEEEGRSNVPAYVTIGIAGAGIILGTVFGVIALGKKSDFDDKADSGTGTAEELTELADDAERSALIADMSFGVALTFGITGAVLLFSNMGDEDAEETPDKASAAPKLAPYAGPTGGGMAATWTF